MHTLLYSPRQKKPLFNNQYKNDIKQDKDFKEVILKNKTTCKHGRCRANARSPSRYKFNALWPKMYLTYVCVQTANNMAYET